MLETNKMDVSSELLASCQLESDQVEDMEVEVLSSMWPEDINSEKPYNVEKPGGDEDMLQEVTIVRKAAKTDFSHLIGLTDYTDRGSSQLASLVKHWEYKQANAVRLLREELDILSRQKEEVELKKLEILEHYRFEEEKYIGDQRLITILDESIDTYRDVPRRKSDVVIQRMKVEVNVEFDTVAYWKQRAMHLEKLLEASVQREQALVQKLNESIRNLETNSSPVEELSQMLKRADNFLHFILQSAPVVMGHQDKDLRYRFIYNHFPSLHEEDILGKTDMEIFTGAGVKESEDFKREVLEKGLAAKREITFETELFGSKTFLIYVEPVFNKAREVIGINYMGMEVTDQVRKREKMAKIREEIAVQKAKETELNKTIIITEETMRAKQMLATMSHEIRSPLSGVVSMAEILCTTTLDREQKQLVNVMISSGDLVLQLINDILDLSKVESGVMKLEATKFRPREVVKHVLHTAAASLQKVLILEGRIADDVPIEVIGDVLRIRQILTNLISNAIKFTQEGKVGINLYVISDPSWSKESGKNQKLIADQPNTIEPREEKCKLKSQNSFEDKTSHASPYQNHNSSNGEPGTPVRNGHRRGGDREGEDHETTVWLCCEVHDTGIGIPENALPTLFKRYMQVSADHARKYGGTGLGLAICKQLVELMGGRLTVSSKVNCGSTFTFILPYKVSQVDDSSSDDPDEMSDMADHEASLEDETVGFFQFKPCAASVSLFSSNGSIRPQKLLPHGIGFTTSHKLNGFIENSHNTCPPTSIVSKDTTNSVEDACSMVEANETSGSEPESSFSHSPESMNKNAVHKIKRYEDDKNHIAQTSCLVSPTQLVADREVIMKAEKGIREIQRQNPANEKSETITQCKPGGSSQVLNPESKPKILLVEDNKINVMVTKSMMKQLGHTIDVVNNGVEAVRAVMNQCYELVFMDVCMPIMDGLQATRLIRSFEETGNWDAALNAGIEPLQGGIHNSVALTKRMPIIAMTANALSESAEECYANGMDSFVSKPVTFQKLKECLEQYLP